MNNTNNGCTIPFYCSEKILYQLKNLRDLYQKKQITLPSFSLHAAFLYCENRKWRRAERLLQLIASSNLTSGERKQFLFIQTWIDDLKKYKDLTCSLNMIVRNEASHLPLVLDSIEGIMDELVIVDTGSVDESPLIASLYGSTLIHKKWQNDFSMSRNTALQASTTDWILWCDADDCFESSQVLSLEKLWKTAPIGGYLFRIRNHLMNAGWSECLQVRLFPLHQDIRFEQAIHEQIMASIDKHGYQFFSHPEIVINHYGYQDPSLHRKKALRNKILIEQELLKKPHDPALRLCSADCLLVCEEFESAKSAYLSIIESNEILVSHRDIYTQALVNAGSLYLKQNHLKEAIELFERCIEIDQTRIEAHYALATISQQNNEYEKTIYHLTVCAKSHTQVRLTATNAILIQLQALYRLCKLLLEKNEIAIAHQIILAAMQLFPNESALIEIQQEIQNKNASIE